MVRKSISELTLKDKLSRLTFTRACNLLGHDGRNLIKEGAVYDIKEEAQVKINDERFSLQLHDAYVEIKLNRAKKRTARHSMQPM